MKKLLLLTALGVTTLGDVNAQLALQNFNASTIPVGWSTIKVDNNTPSSSLNAWIISQMTTNAWMIRTRTTTPVDSCMLTTSLFTPAGTADRWLLTPSFMVNSANAVISWEDAQGIQGASDGLEVWVSTNNGNTVADFTQMVYSANVTPFVSAVTYEKHGAPLGTFNGQTIRVAFRNHSTNGGTIRLDNVQTEVPANPVDAGATGITFPKIVASTSSNQVKITVKNNGAQAITSLNLNYVLDGGTPVPQNFTSLNIYPFSSVTLTFTTPITNPSIAAHSIVVNILQVNGATDPVTTNNQATFAFTVPTQTVPRAGLIEEFSSSTCPPCAAFNATFDPLATANHANNGTSNFNLVKYQMNWPTPDNDKSYNAHGLSRRTYYGINAIPGHFTNGATGGAGDQAEIDASKTAPAYMNITGDYVIHGTSMDVTATVTPYFTIGGNYKIFVAAVQRAYYLNDGVTTTVGQYDFVYVMRRMFPDGNGTTVSNWTAGTPQTLNWNTQPFTIGTVTQNSFNFWNSPIASDIVIFVQDATTGEVLQSKSIAARWPTDVPTIANDTKVMIAPNPANDFTIVALDMATAGSVSLSVTDALGRIVHTTTQQMKAGRNDIGINTSKFATGLYNVTIQTEKGSITERLSIVK